jgi:hypothetical protein
MGGRRDEVVILKPNILSLIPNLQNKLSKIAHNIIDRNYMSETQAKNP